MKNQTAFLFSLAKTNTVLSRRLSGHGLDFSDFMILYYLNEAPEKKLRRIDLANKLGLSASGITRMLLPLEKLGIVTRDLNDDDARARYATLTNAGSELLRDANASLEMKSEDIFLEGCDNKIEEFTTFLDDITDNLVLGEYSEEAKVRWGHTNEYKESQEKIKKMSKEDIDRIKKEGENLMQEIVLQMDKGANSPEVQKLIAKHYDNLRNFYEPNLELYKGLGEMYVNDERFTAYFEKFATGLAKFMKEAINIFCEKNN
jgi:DNA-binding MarR family transcriptional regulator